MVKDKREFQVIKDGLQLDYESDYDVICNNKGLDLQTPKGPSSPVFFDISRKNLLLSQRMATEFF